MNNKIEYKGEIYQVGKYYLFGDKPQSHYFYGELKSVDASCYSPFFAGGDNWKSCKEIYDNNHGTITKAPIILEHGCAYQFKNIEENTISGIYSEDKHSFTSVSVEWLADSCTNIVKLVPELMESK